MFRDDSIMAADTHATAVQESEREGLDTGRLVRCDYCGGVTPARASHRCDGCGDDYRDPVFAAREDRVDLSRYPED